MLRKDAVEQFLEIKNQRDLLFGYIRRAETKYRLNVPTLIAHICAAFYFVFDEWDLKWQHEVTISNTEKGVCVSRKSISDRKSEWRAMFG